MQSGSLFFADRANIKNFIAVKFLNGGNSMRIHYLIILAVALTLPVVTGCASSRGGKVYSRDQARTAQSVYYATVIRVEEVTIEGREGGLGGVAGGVVGGFLGNTVGGGSGKGLATAAGAVGGMAAGAAAEKAATTKAGLEIEVERDDGRMMVVVQEKDDEFAAGDRVRLISGRDGSWRVRQ
jgi:outer membrane lipoprotein SlyB